MDIVWEILRKPISGLTTEEFAVFVLVLLICLTLAGIALSMLVQQSGKLERDFPAEPRSVKKSMARLGKENYLEERLGHTD